jgi:Flp pilus assembly protein TadB
MVSSLLPLKLLSSLASCASVSLFLHWLAETVNEMRTGALLLLEKDDLAHDWSGTKFPLTETVWSTVVLLLPKIRMYRDRNHFHVPQYLTGIEPKLEQAGIRSRIAPEQFLAVCVLCGGGLAIGGFIFGLMAQWSVTALLLFVSPLMGLVGFSLPGWILDNHIANRIALLEKRLPFAIEFIVLSMRANASFAAAVEVYCEQMQNDPLSAELRQTLRDVNYGLQPQAALHGLALRLRSDGFTAFVTAVNSGLDTGQPMKDLLEVQSSVLRQRRYESAEQIAKTASTRATFPLFVVAVAVMLLLLAPLLIGLAHQSLL